MTKQKQLAITGNLKNHPHAASRRLGLWRMLNNIHREVETTLAAMRQADEVLDRTTRTTNGHEFAGYAVKGEVSAKYYNPLAVVSGAAMAAMDNEAAIA
jgi:hypothetical protein